jgi:hypothetical protein
MASKLEMLSNAKEFMSLPEGLRLALRWYSWIKADCVYTKNFETWDETLIFREWATQTVKAIGKSISIVPLPKIGDITSEWFLINNHLDTESLRDMQTIEFTLKKSYSGHYCAISDEEEIKRLEAKRLREIKHNERTNNDKNR